MWTCNRLCRCGKPPGTVPCKRLLARAVCGISKQTLRAKEVARAARALPVAVICVSKGSSAAAEAVASTLTFERRVPQSLLGPMFDCMLSQHGCPVHDATCLPLRHMSANANADEWAGKLQRYVQVDQLNIKPNPRNAAVPDVAVAAEGEKVLKALKPQVYVLSLGFKKVGACRYQR